MWWNCVFSGGFSLFLGNDKLFGGQIWTAELWVGVGQHGGKCRSVGLFAAAGVAALPFLPCCSKRILDAGAEQSNSTAQSELFNSRQKSCRIALQIICACGERVSDCAVFSVHYLEICSWDLYLQLLSPEPPFMLQFRCSVQSFHSLCCGSADAALMTGCCLFPLTAVQCFPADLTHISYLPSVCPSDAPFLTSSWQKGVN